MKKLSIEEMKQIAKEKGGKCLSSKYVTANTHLEWECSEGHRWFAMPKHIKNGHWCRKCSFKIIANKARKYTKEDIHRIAAEKSGKCLSRSYSHIKDPLLWECKHNHRWEAPLDRIIHQGSWCPQCNLPRTITIDEMHSIAIEHNGKCLSDKYINNSTHLEWECENGHKWKAAPKDVLKETWCPFCAPNRKLTLNDMQILAEAKGGKCISEEYINSLTPMEWECEKGHRWFTAPCHITQGSWCHECSPSKPLTLEDMKKIATSRGGKCLSEKYTNANTHLEWECSEGHRWFAVPNMIKQGTWCAQCASGLGERICRAFFEQLFNVKFPTVRPNWLKSKAGFKMELDGFSNELNLAFEHQGEQHYSTNVYFSDRDKELLKTQERDELKLEICAHKGIKVIVIPEVPRLLTIEKLKEYIKNECKRLDILIPSDFEEIVVDHSLAYSASKIDDIKNYALQNKWKCLSDTYYGSKDKLEWECEKGHRRFATFANFKNKKKCPECVIIRKRKAILENLKKIATKKKGKCLSSTYINSYTHLLWECENGHEWKAMPLNIKRHWCPVCARFERSQESRLGIEAMKRIAIERGGRCLSKKYINARTHLEWECEKGHRWEAVPSSVKRGTWCKKCSAKKAGEKRKSIALISGK